METKQGWEAIREHSDPVLRLQEENEQLRSEIQILKAKIKYLLKQQFGSKSEKFDPNQLALELLASQTTNDDSDEDQGDASEDSGEASPDPGRGKPRKKREKTVRMPEDLPTAKVFLDPPEVVANPDAYRRIGEVVTEELDVHPSPYTRRLIIRRKWVLIEDREQPPIIAPLPARPIEGSIASPGLLADITLRKYQDHLPLSRQEFILAARHGIVIPRQTLSDWIGKVTEWLEPIHRAIIDEVFSHGYIQIDETPIRYLNKKGEDSRLGYLWVYNKPHGSVVYDWHTSRETKCLEDMLKEFEGVIQCDGYSAYGSYVKHHKGDRKLEIANCWAHCRRKFHEAQEESPKLAWWFLNQIGLLYRIEKRLRQTKTPAKLRGVVRSAESQIILARLKKALLKKAPGLIPSSLLRKAIEYTLKQWPQLIVYVKNGAVEIDNNLVENAIRPTALGKRNWLFVGHPDAGNRAAVIYTILENCKRYGVNAKEYLCYVLEKLPQIKAHQVKDLTPKNWAERRKGKTAGKQNKASPG